MKEPKGTMVRDLAVGDAVRLVRDLSNDFHLVDLAVGDSGVVSDVLVDRGDYVRVKFNGEALTFHRDEVEAIQ